MIDPPKALVLGLTDDAADVDSPDKFVLEYHKASNPKGPELIGKTYKELFFHISNKAVEVLDDKDDDLWKNTKALIFIGWFARFRPYEDTVFSIALIAKQKEVPFFNSEALHRSKSKLSQHVLFGLNELPIPETIFCHDNQRLLAKAQDFFDLPFIVKATSGSRGSHNFLVKSLQDLPDILEQMDASQRPYCAQRFIPNKGDYRILVMGGQVRLIIHRQGQPASHLNNTSAGGQATLMDVGSFDSELCKLACRAAELLGRQLCGVDIIVSENDGQPYILEVNNMPQLATGSFVPEKMQALAKMLAEVA